MTKYLLLLLFCIPLVYAEYVVSESCGYQEYTDFPGTPTWFTFNVVGVNNYSFGVDCGILDFNINSITVDNTYFGGDVELYNQTTGVNSTPYPELISDIGYGGYLNYSIPFTAQNTTLAVVGIYMCNQDEVMGVSGTQGNYYNEGSAGNMNVTVILSDAQDGSNVLASDDETVNWFCYYGEQETFFYLNYTGLTVNNKYYLFIHNNDYGSVYKPWYWLNLEYNSSNTDCVDNNFAYKNNTAWNNETGCVKMVEYFNFSYAYNVSLDVLGDGSVDFSLAEIHGTIPSQKSLIQSHLDNNTGDCSIVFSFNATKTGAWAYSNFNMSYTNDCGGGSADIDEFLEELRGGSSVKVALYKWNPPVYIELADKLPQLFQSKSLDSTASLFGDVIVLFFKYIFRQPASLVATPDLNSD